jgi:hypothetical protein
MGPEAGRVLSVLAGGALDVEALEADFEAYAPLVELLARLWELPLDGVEPAPIFSARWERRG